MNQKTAKLINRFVRMTGARLDIKQRWNETPRPYRKAHREYLSSHIDHLRKYKILPVLK